MENSRFEPVELPPEPSPWGEEYAEVEVVAEPPHEYPHPPRSRRLMLPAVLFLLTCYSTLSVGQSNPQRGWHPWMYALPLMTILVCHEAGHFIQARRYGVHASLPFFIPMPLSPIGTLGAVIAMEARVGDRKALFDIGITGPLAGLVPTFIFCILGLHWSQVESQGAVHGTGLSLGAPLVFELLAAWLKGPVPEGAFLSLHPVAFAGWVGLLITALNLFPIGQLDGGHVLYGLLRRHAHSVAWGILVAAAAAVLVVGIWLGHTSVLGWLVMICLLLAMGPRHPPTANDYVPLGVVRTVLGWLTLAFVPIGFTPMPFIT